MSSEKQNPARDISATGPECKADGLPNQDTGKALSRQQRWRQRNPKSYLAHLTIANAMRLGVVKRQPCQVCGEPKSEAHHPDYDSPLQVDWLCRRHHKARHSLKGLPDPDDKAGA